MRQRSFVALVLVLICVLTLGYWYFYQSPDVEVSLPPPPTTVTTLPAPSVSVTTTTQVPLLVLQQKLNEERQRLDQLRTELSMINAEETSAMNAARRAQELSAVVREQQMRIRELDQTRQSVTENAAMTEAQEKIRINDQKSVLQVQIDDIDREILSLNGEIERLRITMQTGDLVINGTTSTTTTSPDPAVAAVTALPPAALIQRKISQVVDLQTQKSFLLTEMKSLDIAANNLSLAMTRQVQEQRQQIRSESEVLSREVAGIEGDLNYWQHETERLQKDRDLRKNRMAQLESAIRTQEARVEEIEQNLNQ